MVSLAGVAFVLMPDDSLHDDTAVDMQIVKDMTVRLGGRHVALALVAYSPFQGLEGTCFGVPWLSVIIEV